MVNPRLSEVQVKKGRKGGIIEVEGVNRGGKNQTQAHSRQKSHEPAEREEGRSKGRIKRRSTSVTPSSIKHRKG
jgi:hypothetical protein